jgi:hypothetical protein
VSFQKSIHIELEKNSLSDLSKLFAKYVEHFDQLRAKYPELSGFSEISASLQAPVVSIPAFVFPSSAKSDVEIKPLETMKTDGSKSKFSFDFRTPSNPVMVSTNDSTKLKPVETSPTKPSMNFSFAPTPTEPVDTTTGFQFKSFASKSENTMNSVETKDKEINSPEKKQPSSSFSFSFGGKPNSEGSFGTPPPSLETPAPKPFSFLTTIDSTKPFAFPNPSSTEVGSQDSIANEDEEHLEPSTITVIRTGAGEENEECLAEARVKLLAFIKDEGWSDLGVGIFKVNKNKENNSEGPKSRTLCRSEASGLILLNSAIDKSFSKVIYEDGKKMFTLTALSKEGVPTTYSVRTNLPCESESLVNAIRSQLS